MSAASLAGERMQGDWETFSVQGFQLRRKADPPPHPPRGYGEKFGSLDLAAVLNWTEDDRRDAFRQSAMKRAKLDQIKRNALIVAGNHLMRGEDELLARRIEAMAGDDTESPLVRETARVTFSRLRAASRI